MYFVLLYPYSTYTRDATELVMVTEIEVALTDDTFALTGVALTPCEISKVLKPIINVRATNNLILVLFISFIFLYTPQF